MAATKRHRINTAEIRREVGPGAVVGNDFTVRCLAAEKTGDGQRTRCTLPARSPEILNRESAAPTLVMVMVPPQSLKPA